MDATTESLCLRHEPCPECGSEDNLARYSDGHGYCFGCKYYEHGEGSEMGEALGVAAKPAEFEVVHGDFNAIPHRKLTKDTCEKWGYSVGTVFGEPCQIATYRDATGKIVGQKYRFANKAFSSVGKIGDYLYGMNLWGKGKKLVIVEGEVDALSLSQLQGHKWPVVSIPNGAGNAKKTIKHNLKWLEDNFDEIIIMFDMDEVGQEAAKECATLFTPGKCSIAVLPEKDVNDCLVNGKGEEVIRAIWNARKYQPEGIATVTDLLPLIGKKPEFGTSYPWPRLTVLTYGEKPGQVYVWTSGSGMGKTEFLKEIISHNIIMHKKKCGVIFLEEQAQDTVIHIASKIAQKNFSAPEYDHDIKERDAAIKLLEDSKCLYLFRDGFGHDNYETIRSLIRHMVVSMGCEVIFLDHLTAFTDGLPSGEANSLMEKIMKELATMTRELSFTLHAVSHIRKSENSRTPAEEGGRVKIDDMKGSGAIKQWANFVIALERNQQSKDQDTARTTKLRILKARDAGKNVGKIVKVMYDPVTTMLTELDDVFDDAEESKDNPF